MSIQVLLVDDSAVVRQTLGGLLQAAPDMELQAAVSDPLLAMTRMRQQWPDVIVLDVEMPRMDGITFLRKIMQERPTPVVICSTLTESGAQTTMEAMAAGAFTAIAKPKLGLKQFLTDSAQDFLNTIRAAAQARVERLVRGPAAAAVPTAPASTGVATTATAVRAPSSAAAPVATAARASTPKLSADVMLPSAPRQRAMTQTTQRVVAIGTSTGGTQALEEILTALPRLSPGIVIVQHMPEKFTAAFAKRLDGLCAIDVREAQNGDRVLPGLALIAPGGKHMLLRRSGAQYVVDVKDGPLVNRHRPSVNVLFRSVAHNAGGNALGLLLTGMGDDGAVGLGEMRAAGAHTVAQDEASCVVFGMPKEAIKRNAAEQVLPLSAMATEILKQFD